MHLPQKKIFFFNKLHNLPQKKTTHIYRKQNARLDNFFCTQVTFFTLLQGMIMQQYSWSRCSGTCSCALGLCRGHTIVVDCQHKVLMQKKSEDAFRIISLSLRFSFRTHWRASRSMIGETGSVAHFVLLALPILLFLVAFLSVAHAFAISANCFPVSFSWAMVCVCTRVCQESLGLNYPFVRTAFLYH